MGVISVGNEGPDDIWKVSNWALRELFSRARMDQRTDDLVTKTLDRAEAFNSLQLEHHDSESARHLASILRTAASDLAADLLVRPRDQRDLELAAALRELDALLERTYA